MVRSFKEIVMNQQDFQEIVDSIIDSLEPQEQIFQNLSVTIPEFVSIEALVEANQYDSFA
jgi:hypothetical protein